MREDLDAGRRSAMAGALVCGTARLLVLRLPNAGVGTFVGLRKHACFGEKLFEQK